MLYLQGADETDSNETDKDIKVPPSKLDTRIQVCCVLFELMHLTSVIFRYNINLRDNFIKYWDEYLAMGYRDFLINTCMGRM